MNGQSVIYWTWRIHSQPVKTFEASEMGHKVLTFILKRLKMWGNATFITLLYMYFCIMAKVIHFWWSYTGDKWLKYIYIKLLNQILTLHFVGRGGYVYAYFICFLGGGEVVSDNSNKGTIADAFDTYIGFNFSLGPQVSLILRLSLIFFIWISKQFCM